MNLQREKLINAVIYFCSHTKMCGKTKLVKLLYYFDFMHFRQTAKSVTGLKYYAWQFGPYPVSFANEIDSPPEDISRAIFTCKMPDNNLVKIKVRAKFNKDVFSKRELKLLEEVAYIFKEARAEDMIEASHLPNHPWDMTLKTKGEKSEIDYMLSLDSKKGSISIQEAVERIQDREVMNELAITAQR